MHYLNVINDVSVQSYVSLKEHCKIINENGIIVLYEEAFEDLKIP